MKNFYLSLLCVLFIVNFSSAHNERLNYTTEPVSELVSGITGTGPFGSSAVSVGKYVKTSASFTYTVSPVAGATSYVWTVPTGVTILNGQGTNTITVNYIYVTIGAGSIGDIEVQPMDGANPLGNYFKLNISKAVPNGPLSINLYDKNSATPNDAIYNIGKYLATVTPLTLTAAVDADASFYKWELPAGVNVFPAGTTPITSSNTFIEEPFVTVVATPTTPGTKYWVVTTKVYIYSVNSVPTKVAVSTAVQNTVGGVMNKPYKPFGTVITSDLNSILIDFQGVKVNSTYYLGVKAANGVGLSGSNNSGNSDVLAASGSPATSFEALYSPTYTESLSGFDVTGYEVTSAKLLRLQAFLPGTPKSLLMTDDAVSLVNGVTNFASYRSTTTPLTLTAPPVSTASFYKWELPAGVNVILTGINFGTFSNTFTSKTFNAPTTAPTTPGTKYWVTTTTIYICSVRGVPTRIAVSTAVQKVVGGSTVPYTPFGTTITSDLPSVRINFSGVSLSATDLYIGVKASNVIGLSDNDNSARADVVATSGNPTLIPGLYYPTYTEALVSTFTLSGYTPSTARLLKLVAQAIAVPAAPRNVTGVLTGICPSTPYSYVIEAVDTATSYIITAPAGSVVTSSSNLTNNSNVLTTSDLTFSVIYPVGVLNPSTITVFAANSAGSSTTGKILYLSNSVPLLDPTVSGPLTFVSCLTKTITVPSNAVHSNYVWTVSNGATIQSGQGTNTIVVSFSAVTVNKTSILVYAETSCGAISKQRAITLTRDLINPCSKPEISSKESLSSNVSEVAPNPTTGVFSIDVEGSNGDVVEIAIYSTTGVSVMSPKSVTLQEGNNTISEDISSLAAGVYFVQIRNSNETIVKKVVKQ